MSRPPHLRRLSRFFAAAASLSVAVCLPLVRAQTTSPSLEEARSLHAGWHLTEAASALEQILVTTPDNVAALVELARIRLDQADEPTARTLLSRALAVSPNSPQGNNTLGTLLLNAHQYPEAMDRFETTLAIAPQDPAARAGEFQSATALALQARASGKPEAALLCLEHASEHLPNNPELLTDIGLVAGDLHLYHRAERALTTAISLDPKNTRALYAAGRVSMDAGHLPQAESYFRAYLAQKPDDATAHFGLGRVLAVELNTADAKSEFETSIRLRPTQSESFYQLGVLAANARSDSEAESLFHQTLSRNPRHVGALTGMGQIAYGRKLYPTANTFLSQAIAVDPSYQPAHYYLGLTLARLGQAAASAHELERAAELTQQQQSRAAPKPGEAITP